ncbi:hypothetical protein JAAARDRAFT_198733 [Jaapia argillacea MUCL 33604]|uniref:Uncharacterized protein n=1 Tax=Jaapia argillacea MUCL 33604 TaxID=933084 RepID=A0A067PAR2_9AGAM|nr:hypothetical protein JAAARDRAFT_198733 [Jaapia argillacea MUCL 33604]
MSGPYNLPRTDRDADDAAYNPQADALVDSAGFDDSTDPEAVSVAPRGADNQATNLNAAKEDREAERSEASGRVTRGEVDALRSDLAPEEKNVKGKTRGKKVDAYRQERDVDRALEETGVDPGEQDVEISAADGRRR